MTKHVLVDLHRLRHNPFNGLYRFCRELGTALIPHSTPSLRLHYYVPATQIGTFGDPVSYAVQRSVDKYYRLGTRQYDVWHATTGLSWYRPFNRHTRIIYTIHDLNFLIEEPDQTARNKRLLRQMQERANRAHQLVFISDYVQQYCERYMQLGDKPRTVIYNGGSGLLPDISHHTPDYLPKRPFLFAVGLVQPRKNFHLLPALLQNNEYELVIAGLNDFEYGKTVAAAIAEWGMQDRARLIGPVSEADKAWYYQHCSAFLFPSFAEGFGLPLIEAMQYGKPVFTTRETCLPEIGGDAAFYFSALDPEAMQTDFARGMDLFDAQRAEQCRQRAALFTWDRAAAQYAQLYHQWSTR
jgi:glycosyltransferase involved in cell wall biosynthesis